MAITEDMDSPRLTPPDDRMPSGSSLFRSPAELTDEQFDLLAAAWAEGALSGESLEELESVMAASAERRDRAGSFCNIRLVPCDESWPGMRSAIRLSPVQRRLRRSVIPALLAVAAMVVMIIYGPTVLKLKTINSGKTVTRSTMTVAEIQVPPPIVAPEKKPATHTPSAQVAQTPVAEENALPGLLAEKNAMQNLPAEENVLRGHFAEVNALQGHPAEESALQGHFAEANTPQGYPAAEIQNPDEITGFVRVQPLALARGYASVPSVAPEIIPAITSINIMDIQPAQTLQEEKNWIIRTISFLASAVAGEEKEIDGYIIANGCINGIKNALGWDMELDLVSNKSGEPVAVTFRSSLLSFIKPLNKTTP